jgi:hypothetical protein
MKLEPGDGLERTGKSARPGVFPSPLPTPIHRFRSGNRLVGQRQAPTQNLLGDRMLVWSDLPGRVGTIGGQRSVCLKQLVVRPILDREV